MTYQSAWMNPELSAFRDQFRRFLKADLAPKAEGWRRAKMVDRDAWRALGGIGALLPSVPEAYGGGGGTFAFEAAVIEDITGLVPELATGVSVHSAIVAHYILNYGSHEQKQRCCPPCLPVAESLPAPGRNRDSPCSYQRRVLDWLSRPELGLM